MGATEEYVDRVVEIVSTAVPRLQVSVQPALEVADVTGVLASVATCFAEHGVSIQTVRQQGRGSDAQLVIVTHRAPDAALSATVRALRTIEAAGWTTPTQHPDLVPAAEAGRLADLLRSLGESDDAKGKPPEFRRWLVDAATHSADLEAVLLAASSAPAAPAELSEQLKVIAERCDTCHRAPGIAPANIARVARGPALEGLYGSEVTLRGGSTVTADDTYLRESIVNPMAKVVAGWDPVMPTFQGQVSEEQLTQLIAYIQSLGKP